MSYARIQPLPPYVQTLRSDGNVHVILSPADLAVQSPVLLYVVDGVRAAQTRTGHGEGEVCRGEIPC